MGVGEKVKEVTSSAKRRVGAEAPLAADEDGKIGVVRGALRAFGEGDMDGFVDALNDDVVWESPEGKCFPGAGEHRGPDEVRKSFIEDVGRTYTSFGFRPDSFLETDKEDAVIVIGRFEGDGVEGDRVDESAVQVWEFQGNAVARVRIFTDSAGFPSVITERREQEMEEEEREKKEKQEKEEREKDEAKASSESDSDPDRDGEGEQKESDDKKSDDDG